MPHDARIAGIFVYPVKSTAALPVARAVVEPRGLADDRRWMVTDASGDFVTGRDHPRLVMVRARPTANGLTLGAPGMPDIAVTNPGLRGHRSRLQIWNDHCAGLSADDDANAWLSGFLGIACRLHYMDPGCVRPLDGIDGGEVSFADNFPLLLIGGASLEDLNARLPQPVDVRRFRPNLVACGAGAYAEDGWQRIRIGDAVLRAAERCDRCAFTIIDPDTAEKHPEQEPLRTLSRVRRGDDGGVYFGKTFVPERCGEISVGDEIEVME